MHTLSNSRISKRIFLGKNHREDLLKDLTWIVDASHIHYTGTIVVTEDSEKQIFNIVDGQQRLISLLLLINVIIRKYPSMQTHNEHGDLWALFIDDKKMGEKGRKFILNQETDSFFYTIINHGETVTPTKNKSEKNIGDAVSQFSHWIEEEINRDRIDAYLNAVLNKFGFLLYAPEDTKEVGAMFEVINNRGKPLSELEKIKNYLIYYSIKTDTYDLREAILKHWEDLITNISAANIETNEEENKFIRYCWWTYEKFSKEGSYNIYEKIKDKWDVEKHTNENTDKIKNFIYTLVRFSMFYRNMYEDKISDKLNDETNHWIQRIRYQPVHMPIIPLYFASSFLLFNDEFKDLYTKVLEIIEKLNFRVYVLPSITKRSDTGITELYQIAHSFFTQSLYNEKVVSPEENTIVYQTNLLIEKLISYARSFSKVEKVVEALTLDRNEDYNYYKWQGLKYFLIMYEEHLNKKRWIDYNILQRGDLKGKSDDKVSIEHVWALKNKSELNERPEFLQQKNRLGNFVLLELGNNIVQSDNDIELKKEQYDKLHGDHSISQFITVQKLPAIIGKALTFVNNKFQKKHINYYRELSAKINDIRETDMIKFALERWKLDGDADITCEINSFKDQRRNEIYFLKDKQTGVPFIRETNLA